MEWIREDCFCFRQQMPTYIEEDHLLVMGFRSDYRVYYAVIPIPEYPEVRALAYKELRRTFDGFLDAPVTSPVYSAHGYAELVNQWCHRKHGFMLDEFPSGE